MSAPNHSLHLGKLQGPLLVFGGPYSNLQALQALREVANQKGIPADRIICTGDVVAYCAQPEESVQFIRDWGIHCISGNVEQQLASGQADCACDFRSGGRCDTFSKQWYPFAQSQLSDTSLNWMRQLPEFIRFEYAKQSVFVLHGSYHHTSEFIFESTDWAIKAKNFEATQSDVILAGHCGLPFSHQQAQQIWLNAGVIGMPANDGTPNVWYLLLNDFPTFTYQHLPLSYDHTLANTLMQAKPLPQTYAKTLLTGIWDNCEILPEDETKRQGIPIILG